MKSSHYRVHLVFRLSVMLGTLSDSHFTHRFEETLLLARRNLPSRIESPLFLPRDVTGLPSLDSRALSRPPKRLGEPSPRLCGIAAHLIPLSCRRPADFSSSTSVDQTN